MGGPDGQRLRGGQNAGGFLNTASSLFLRLSFIPALSSLRNPHILLITPLFDLGCFELLSPTTFAPMMTSRTFLICHETLPAFTTSFGSDVGLPLKSPVPSSEGDLVRCLGLNMASRHKEQAELTMSLRQAGSRLSRPFDMGIGETFDFIYFADIYQSPQQKCCKNLQQSLSSPLSPPPGWDVQ